ncbi:MAG: hypothetical protein U1E65_16695 [Myxococcota bacterium]
MRSWEENAKFGPHLERIAAVPLKSVGPFVYRDGFVYAGARHGNDPQVTVIDARKPAEPRVVGSLPFKRSILSMALSGERLLVGESQRALHIYDLQDPAAPKYLDCVVSLGKDICAVDTLGELAAAGLNWGGVGLMDLKTLRWVSEQRLEEGFVEELCVAQGLIFAAGASGGLVVFRAEGGKLEEVARPCGSGFNASEVFPMGSQVWVAGARKNKPELVVIDPRAPDRVVHRLSTKISTPRSLRATRSGVGLGFFTHYTCAQYDPAGGTSGMLFRQYLGDEDQRYYEMSEARAQERGGPRMTCMDTISQMEVVGKTLIAAQGEAITVYRILPGSAFEECL